MARLSNINNSLAAYKFETQGAIISTAMVMAPFSRITLSTAAIGLIFFTH